MLEGTAALAQFRKTPNPQWNTRALAAFQRAMALADPNSAAEWQAWADAAASAASILCDLARYSEAEPLLRDCLRIREASGQPKSPRLAAVLNDLALLLVATNRIPEAEPMLAPGAGNRRAFRRPGPCRGRRCSQRSGGTAASHESPGGSRAAFSPRTGDRREVVRPESPHRRDRPQ